jgi:predicted ATPase
VADVRLVAGHPAHRLLARGVSLENLTDALSASTPAPVVLEDVRWSDPIAIRVLQHLPDALHNAPIAFIATSRDHEVDMPPLADLCRASRVINLDGLDVDAVPQTAVADAAGSAGGPVDAVALHARTGGNPLFVQCAADRKPFALS